MAISDPASTEPAGKAEPAPAPTPRRRRHLRPPMPDHPPRAISPYRALHIARQNVISVWRPEAYFAPFMAEKYLFRWMYVANNPDAVRHVMVANVDNYWKSGTMRMALKPLVGNGSFVSNGSVWKRQRRINIPAFHHSRIRIFAGYMGEEAQSMLDQWAGHDDGAELEVNEEMANVTASVVCRSMFSEDLGANGKIVFDAFTEYQATLHQIDYAEMLGLPRFLSQRPGRRAVKAARVIDRVIRGIIAERWGEEDDRGDFLSTLLAARDEETGEGLTEDEIRDEMSVIFLAGHETTANTLSWALYLLSKDPATEERLHAEVDEVLAGRVPGYDDLERLPFARAVIEETLRLYPPVPLYSRTAREADEIDGVRIEPGSNMIVCPWLLHRHRLLWDKPNQFVPDRFLPGNRKGMNKYQYVPFGAGPRTCIGASFGLLEAVIILASIAQRFRLRLRDGFEIKPIARLSLRPNPSVPMRLERR